MKSDDIEVLRPFTEGRFRAADRRQIAEIRNKPEDEVGAALERLWHDGLLATMFPVSSWPAGSRALTRPLAVREKGQPCPDLQAVWHKVRSRRMVDCHDRRTLAGSRYSTPYRVTKEAIDRLGGVLPDIALCALPDDDVCMTDVYIAVLKGRPQLAANWFSEDAYRAANPGLGNGVVDAVAIDADGSPRAFKYVGISPHEAWRGPGWVGELNRRLEVLGIFDWELW
jgi:hypothetical protein